MGAAKGNQNAASKKPWTAAIHRALEKRGEMAKADALDLLAEKLLAKCDEADMVALKELGDRIEGKPTQTIAGDPDNPVEHMVRWQEPKK